MARGAKESISRSRPARSGNQCMIALELRPRLFGFAVFEGPGMLLDWGARTYQCEERPDAAIRKLEPLIQTYAPIIVVVRKRSNLSRYTQRNVRALTEGIRRILRSNSISFGYVTTKQVRSHFAPYGCKTKQEIGAVLSVQFEELAGRLPPKRKPWQSERHSMIIFDAVASGSVYFGSNPRLSSCR